MTLETWKKEFYPVPADDPSIDTSMKATLHSLQKWIGLRKENLNKHSVYMFAGYVDDFLDFKSSIDPGLCINADSCALCKIFRNSCFECPLYQVRTRPCDKCLEEETYSPFSDYIINYNPEPMISWLLKTVEMLNLKNKS